MLYSGKYTNNILVCYRNVSAHMNKKNWKYFDGNAICY